MRPLRIELKGFMAYRSRVEIDLEEAGFFSLSGPTGSGKSSLIDAVVFALYGRVPRLGAKSVAPVISSGAERATVLLEFESNGTVYTVVRSAKRTATGATTDEVRLQEGTDVLADGADSVSTAVDELLSLGFEDFTRTVVLPQGEFAEFLVATPGKRQDLLRKLLAFDFSEVRALAVTRGEVAKSAADSAERKLEDLDVPDDEARTLASARLAALDDLAGRVVYEERSLAQLGENLAAATAVRESVAGSRSRLEALQPPKDIGRLEQSFDDARSSLDKASEAFEVASIAVTEATQARDSLPGSETIRSGQKLREKLSGIEEQIEDLRAESEAPQLEKVEGELASTVAERDAARARLTEARADHAAHVLRGVLVTGEECPVCLATVTEVPASEAPSDLAVLEESEAELGRRVEELRREVSLRKEIVAGQRATNDQLQVQREALQEELVDVPSEEELEQMLVSVEAAELLISTRVNERNDAETSQKEAQRRVDDVAESLNSITRELMAARERVAGLDPPLPESDDPVVQWKELLAWRDEATLVVDSDLAEAEGAVADLKAQFDEKGRGLIEELDDLGVPTGRPHSVEVTKAQSAAQQVVSSQESALATANELLETMKEAREQAAIADSLAQHLKVSGFEKWLMAGALSDLVDGANGLLEELADGGFSLDYDSDGSFRVVDHRNADEVRPVSTLSGGETFLASLALALSLAETLSGSSGAELNAIILDEGFGTLDDESLDTVASVLEDLTSQGLMVGVISHVKELAIRAPVRFEVQRGPGGAEVRRVS